ASGDELTLPVADFRIRGSRWRSSKRRDHRGLSGLRRGWRRWRAIGDRQHLVAVVGDEHRMFPLRRKAVVGGHDGPAIGQTANAGPAGIDHRLDRENHSRLQLESRPGPPVMQNLRLLVELAADAVTAEFTHHGKAVAFGVALYRRADVAQGRAGLDRANATPHRVEGHFTQTLGLDRRRSDIEHTAAVAVKAVLDHGHVDVHDVAGFELFVAGDAMTDHVI